MFFFFNATATTQIYTLSLHDALPISQPAATRLWDDVHPLDLGRAVVERADAAADRKSTRLNSSHTVISYAVFCLKKKNRSETRASGRTPPWMPPAKPTPARPVPST